MSLDYVYEKTYLAVHALATGSGPIQERLGYAAMDSHTIGIVPERHANDWPDPDLYDRWKALWERLTVEPATDRLSSMQATANSLSDEDATALAQEFFAIYNDVHEAYVMTHQD